MHRWMLWLIHPYIKLHKYDNGLSEDNLDKIILWKYIICQDFLLYIILCGFIDKAHI